MCASVSRIVPDDNKIYEFLYYVPLSNVARQNRKMIREHFKPDFSTLKLKAARVLLNFCMFRLSCYYYFPLTISKTTMPFGSAGT